MFNTRIILVVLSNYFLRANTKIWYNEFLNTLEIKINITGHLWTFLEKYNNVVISQYSKANLNILST